jgi:hypothetical protein
MGIGLNGLGLTASLPSWQCQFTGQIIATVENSFSWVRCMKGDIKQIDLIQPQHADRQFIFSVVDGAGNPEDISGVTDIVWAVATGPSATKLLTKTLSGGSIQLSGTDKFYFTVTKTESAALRTGGLYHDCLITTAAGSNRVPFQGKFTHKDTLAGDA